NILSSPTATSPWREGQIASRVMVGNFRETVSNTRLLLFRDRRATYRKIRDAHHEAASTPLRQHISSPKTKGSRWYVLLIGSEEHGSSGWLGSHHGECTTTGMRQRQRLQWQGFISGVPSSTPAQQSSSGMEPRVVVMIGHMKMARPHTHARTNERRRGIIRGPPFLGSMEPEEGWRRELMGKIMKDIYTDVAVSSSSFSTTTICAILGFSIISKGREQSRVTLNNYNGIQISQANNMGFDTNVTD
ncbi:hypothetical protein HID58_067075, partial [Brassica napus]